MLTFKQMIIFISIVFNSISVQVNAYSGYETKVPNGDQSPGNCQAWGHTNCGGGGARWAASTVVGTNTWGVTSCKTDSDGDGYYNGEEVGDACCYGWSSGTVDSTKGYASTGASDPKIGNPRNSGSTPTWSSGLPTGTDIKLYHTTTPGAFTITSAVRSGTNIIVTFGRSAFACHYKIQVSKDNGGTYDDHDFAESDVPSSASPGMYLSTTTYTSKTCTNCAPSVSTAYKVRVVATNNAASNPSRTSNVLDIASSSAAPDAPTNFGSSFASQSITITWTAPASDNGAPITGYKIEMKTGSGSFLTIETSTGDASTTSYTKTQLTNGVAYEFKVSAINSVGTSTALTSPSSITPNVAPSSPSSVTGSRGNSGEIVVSWSAGASSGGTATTGYKIEMKEGVNSYTTIVPDTTDTTTTYTKTGLTNGNSYKFRISAINSFGPSDPTEQSDTTIPVGLPNPPSGASAASGNTQVTLSWNAVTGSNTGGSPVTGYKVLKKVGNNAYQEEVASQAQTTKTFTSLTNGEVYQFRIYTITSVGTSATFSETSPVTPSASGLSINGGVLTANMGTASSTDTKTITIVTTSTPTQPVDVGLTIASAPNDKCTVSPTTVSLQSSNSFSNTFVITSTASSVGTCKIQFTTTSTDTNYNNLSPISDLVITVKSVPDPPTNLLVASTGVSGELKLDWTAPTNTGNTAVSGYKIQMKTGASGPFTTIVSDTTTTSTTYTKSGLVNGESYTFQISTKNEIGFSAAYSSPVVGQPCTAGIVYIPTTAGATILAGSMVSSKIVGKLFLQCPVSTTNAVVKATVTTATPSVCTVSSTHSTLTLPADPTNGVDVSVNDIDISSSTINAGGGPCKLNFQTTSTTDTTYQNLPSYSNIQVIDIKQGTIVVSATTLSLKSGCSTGVADTSITVTTCNGDTNCLGTNGPSTLTLLLTSSDTSTCTVPSELEVAAASTPVSLPITPVGPGTCSVTMVTKVTGTSSNRPYEVNYVGSMPSVSVTVTGGRALSTLIPNWDVLYTTCGDHIKFDVTAKNENNKWISLGVSSTASMGDSDVMICSPGTNTIKRHWLDGYTPETGEALPSTGQGSCSSTDGSTTTMSFRRPLIKTSSKEIQIDNNKELYVVWASGNSDTVDLSVAHTKRGSIKNTFKIDSTSPTPVGGTTPAGGTTNSPSPSTSDDDESNKIEKELRVDGLDKFATVDPSKKLGMTWTLTDKTVDIAIKTKGLKNGWISIAFPALDTPTIMNNADAISGDAKGVKAWKLGPRDVAEEKNGEFLIASSVEVIGEYITFRFTVNTKGNRRLASRRLANRQLADVPISSSDVDTPLLWSYATSGVFEKGKVHTKRGATSINFKTGGSSEAKIPDTNLTSMQSIVSFIIIIVLLLIPMICGIFINQVTSYGKYSKCDCFTQKYMNFCNLLILKIGETSVWLMYFISIAVFIVYRVLMVPSLFEVQRSFGWVACWSGFIVAFPALQSNLLLHLFGIPFERSIKHHRMMGRWFWIFQTIHFILALTSFDLMTLISNFDAPVKPVFVSYGFGFLTWVISTIVALTSLNVVRRKCWEVFYYTHYILTKMVYLFGILHLQGTLFGIVLMGLPLVVWTIERLNRWFGSKSNGSLKCISATIDDSTIALTVETETLLNKNPGDYCFLSISNISKFERHPFSICSDGNQKLLKFRIKNMKNNSFTNKLFKFIQTNNSVNAVNAAHKLLDINVTGPYGTMSINLLNQKYNTLVLCAGGIGVTPMISTLYWLYNNYNKNGNKDHNHNIQHIKKVVFIWAVRYEKQLSWANDVLNTIKNGAPELFQCELYVTKPTGGGGGGGGISSGIEMVNKSFGYGQQVSPSIDNDWTEHNDPNTGKKYYHSPSRNVTTWEKPKEMIGDFDDWDVATASGRTKVNVSSSTKPTRTSDFEWKKGRPKYDALLNDLTPATTCVLACGPAPMVNDVQSKSLSCGFDFHKEIFSF